MASRRGYGWLWPGLAPLWRGEWSGLALAAGFAALLNTLLLANWVWTDLAGTTLSRAGWGLAALVWLVSAGYARRSGADAPGGRPGDGDDLFPAALNEYLQGNWVAAEQAVQRQLRHEPSDAEARLLLATLWRRTGRRDEALAALSHLDRLQEAQRWRLEIARERNLLHRTKEVREPTAAATPAEAPRAA